MTCSVSEEDRKAYAQRVVRLSIREVDGGTRTVTQDTMLGSAGLGHSPTKRRQYHEKIRARLAVNGCVMKTLSPESFAADGLIRVRDVSALVEGDLG